MLKRITLGAFTFSILCLPLTAQQAPDPAPPLKQAAADAEAPKPDADPAMGEVSEPTEVKVLKPVDVPAEMLRIEKRKTKADIKCEVTLTPAHGREVTVKGVVRNGKLIERFAGRVFVTEPSIEHPQCGVRLWWVENTAGWIFLRYSQIRSIALTGVLTAEERRQIMDALRVREQRKEEERKAQDAAKLEEELAQMGTADLENYLLREYPQNQGWNHEKLRDLKKKQLIDNQPLTRQESIFVSYFPALIKARLGELKREKDKVEVEPGSADRPPGPAGAQPAAGRVPVGGAHKAPDDEEFVPDDE
jgi:hypothetical protein